MRIRHLFAIAFMTWVAVWAAADDAPAPPANAPPARTGLTETVEKRLVQIDVAVEGDPAAIRAITAKDFALYVGGHEVTGLIVDRLCGDEPAPALAPTDAKVEANPAPAASPRVTRPRATFIFFFDQTHLTLAGRDFSRETARDLINRLVVEGTRASIVSSAKRLVTVVPMTGDREKLLAGLEKLRNDQRQLETYAETERNRREDPMMSCQRATALAREEWIEARRATERIGFTVGALADAPAPKGLIYFGDNLRQRAGVHYLVGVCPATVVESAAMIPSAAAEFDAVINEALARNVHFFTIQAEGLLVYEGVWDKTRHQHAQDALVALAAETGGEAFLGGASNTYIGGRIEKLTTCRLLLSFPPGDLPQDKSLNVTLVLNVPKVKIQSQGRIVVPSPVSLERARLLSAFADPESSDDGSLRALLIPRGGDGKTWKASVQLRLRPTGLPDNSAELGASIVRHDKVTDHFAASIATKSPSRAIVLEKTLDFGPGEFYVVAVARDAKRGDVGSSRLDGDWPNPAKTEAAIAPIAVLQVGPAAMSKDDVISTSGSLARDVDETLDPSAAVALETVVCRGAKTTAPIIVERWLDGGPSGEFEPMTIADSEGPCLQVVDVVHAGRLKSGAIDYRVVARIGEEIVATERRSLRVGAPVEK